MQPALRLAMRDLIYPRPQLRRDARLSLDGPWRFALDDEGRTSGRHDVEFGGIGYSESSDPRARDAWSVGGGD